MTAVEAAASMLHGRLQYSFDDSLKILPQTIEPVNRLSRGDRAKRGRGAKRRGRRRGGESGKERERGGSGGEASPPCFSPVFPQLASPTDFFSTPTCRPVHRLQTIKHPLFILRQQGNQYYASNFSTRCFFLANRAPSTSIYKETEIRMFRKSKDI